MSSKHIWPAQKYHNHSLIQKNAAMELLQHIRLNKNQQILDVGCGEGKITAILATHVPQGSVLGIDISQEMINFAQNNFQKNEHPNLTFSIQDAQQLNYQGIFDLIFSSFALQWVPNIDSFFEGAYKSLKSSGYLTATIPLGISSALELSIKEITSQAEWKHYFKTFSPGWHFISDTEYSQLLDKHSFTSIRFQVIPQEVLFSSRDSFEDYIIPWFSYLHPLPEHLKKVFFKQVIDRYLEKEPILKNGQILFKFPRLDLIAKKAAL